MNKNQDFTDRVAIITGAGKGLGRAYAIHLAEQGAKVLVNNRRHSGERDEHTSAMQTVDKIRAAGGIAEPNWADVRDPDSGRQMVEQALEQFGRLDIVIANAGIERVQRFENISLDDFESIFNTSFYGNLYLAHAAWPHLIKAGGGNIVLTTSGAGLYANHGQAAYSAAKAAVIGLTRALAIEGRSRNITVNAVAPYAVTAMTSSHMDKQIAEHFDPKLVPPIITWLASESCDITGEVLVTGGGVLRCAKTGETDTLICKDNVGTVVHKLRKTTTRVFPTANDSFFALVSELKLLQQQE